MTLSPQISENSNHLNSRVQTCVRITANITVQLMLHLLVFPRDLLLLSESFLLDDSLERASFLRPQLHGLPLDGDLLDRDCILILSQ